MCSWVASPRSYPTPYTTGRVQSKWKLPAALMPRLNERTYNPGSPAAIVSTDSDETSLTRQLFGFFSPGTDGGRGCLAKNNGDNADLLGVRGPSALPTGLMHYQWAAA